MISRKNCPHAPAPTYRGHLGIIEPDKMCQHARKDTTHEQAIIARSHRLPDLQG